MKRFVASVIVVVAFTFYAVFTRGNSTTQTAVSVSTDTTGTTGSVTTQPVFNGEDDDDEGAVATQPQTVTTVVSAGSSAYTDGTYTGSRANAMYGTVQVKVVIQGGRITDVTFLSHPTGHNSDQINARAVPILTQEAITAQSANVQTVSGATLTSNAFIQSLQSALNQA